MSGFIDVPARALRYLQLQHPTAPADPDRYSSLSVLIDRERGGSLVEDGWWRVEVSGSWWTSDGDVSLSVEVPLSRLLSDDYAVMTEFIEPLW